MKDEVARQLTEINRRFYTAQAEEFAATRRRIQPGVARILAGLPDRAGEKWLDLGCGSGWLAVEWLRAGRKSAYTGLDFSPVLLAEARKEVGPWLDQAAPDSSPVEFRPADFSAAGWETGLAEDEYSGILCFAVLHHLAGSASRARFLRLAASRLRAGGQLWLSVWQFQHSPRLAARELAWEQAGLSAEEVEPGDTLLDWRRTQDGIPALRYVHRFTLRELVELGQTAGLQVLDTFESDGQGGKLGLYVGWIKSP